ncbi:hypothetical protein HYFRA_00003892 [Hymenoscyphus fraxineus]|uniref:Uncharacterized protein n=1 Tax=Hymenoscyphus fraxineus TaxID=746836 RepID=A0A9N9L2H1_9HELO|nr:hypothetical protein HYFRA_00003892 [Hymenoscyphus fraxineus]
MDVKKGLKFLGDSIVAALQLSQSSTSESFTVAVDFKKKLKDWLVNEVLPSKEQLKNAAQARVNTPSPSPDRAPFRPQTPVREVRGKPSRAAQAQDHTIISVEPQACAYFRPELDAQSQDSAQPRAPTRSTVPGLNSPSRHPPQAQTPHQGSNATSYRFEYNHVDAVDSCATKYYHAQEDDQGRWVTFRRHFAAWNLHHFRAADTRALERLRTTLRLRGVCVDNHIFALVSSALQNCLGREGGSILVEQEN